MYSRTFCIAGIVKIGVLLSCLNGCGSVASSRPDAGPDAAPDAALDASPDAAPAMSAAYDIAYVYEFTLNPDIVGANAFLLVINRGTTPIALSTARVVSVEADSGATVTFTKTTDSVHMLAPGRAAGRLSPEAMTKVVTSGLATEPIDDADLDFTMNFSSLPSPGVVHGKVVLEIAATKLDMPFTFHVDANAEPSLTTAQRLSARATP